MELQVGVKVLLKNKANRYLLVKRSSLKYPEGFPEWDIVGGRINPGTLLLENLKREVKEETNLNLSEKIKLIAAQDILRVPGRHVVRLTYLGEADGDPVLSDEHTEFKWFTMNEIKMLGEKELDGYFKELINQHYFL